MRTPTAPKPLLAAVPVRLRRRIHKPDQAGLPKSRLQTLRDFWTFPFEPGLVLAKPNVERLFILNESASFLWSLLPLDLAFPVLADRFCERYGLDQTQATADISSTLAFWDTHLFDVAENTAFTLFVTAPPLPPAAPSEYYRLNGRVVRVSISDPELAAEISPRLESVQTPEHGTPDLTFQVWAEAGRVLLVHEGQLLAAEENPNAVRSILLQEMVRRTEPERDWLAILHAGGCGLGDDALLLAGRSQAGKTTLCAALMASGFTFYCDDSAALGRNDGMVSPMPFRLMVREGSWNVLHSRFPDLLSSTVSERYGQRVRFLTPPPGSVASSPARVKGLLFVSYHPTEKTWLQPLLPFETLLKLQESGFWIQHDRSSIAAFLAWLQTLPAFELTYSDLEAGVEAIRELALGAVS